MIPPRTQTFAEPPVLRREIVRYSSAKESSAELDALIDDCLNELKGRLSYRVCWQEFPISSDGTALDLGFAKTDSAALSKTLAGCSRIVLFAATIGLDIDRLIARYCRLSPARALVMQAIGAERIEALCDTFSEETAARASEEGLKTTPRFSPGYGDLPLSMQTDIFRVLDCPKRIGLTLNASLLMSPTKSVTAIIGLGCPNAHLKHGCASCLKRDCSFRRHP